jgi:streptomycin 6-kinase
MTCAIRDSLVLPPSSVGTRERAPLRLPSAVVSHVESLCLGARVVAAARVRADAADGDAPSSEKGLGYGELVRIELELPDGATRALALHTARADAFGHDRRSDRAAEMLLAYDSFGMVPCHVQALDVGAMLASSKMVSLRDAGELYLLTEWVEGTLYAAELRRVARDEHVTSVDLTRARRLATLLCSIHAEDAAGLARGVSPEALYQRALRDLVGHGEGIAGVADSFDHGVPGAPRSRVEAIERAALGFRHRLRSRSHRLRRVHGDFHPFNILFDARGEPVLLDASRGVAGDPADDVACLAVNFLFFGVALDRARWELTFGRLWDAFWGTYRALRGDDELVEVLAPFLAWRCLVLASPAWYPRLAPGQREVLLSFAERCLAARRFDPAWLSDALP